MSESEKVAEPDGTESWYSNGQLHREDGPAVVWADGTQGWYRNGSEVDPPA